MDMEAKHQSDVFFVVILCEGDGLTDFWTL